MAKRRVGNPLFKSKEPDQFMNLEDPSFLDEMGGDEAQVLDELSGFAAEEAPPPPADPIPVQDARQIPLNPEDDPNLDNPAIQTPNQPIDEYISDGFSGAMKSVFGDPNSPDFPVKPGEDMYSKGMKKYSEDMAKFYPNSEDVKAQGEGFIKGISGNVGQEGDDAATDFMRGMTGMQGDIPPYKNESPEGENFVKALAGQLPQNQDDLEPETLQDLSGFAPQEQPQEQVDVEVPVDPQFVEKISSGQPPVKPEVTEEEVEQRAQTEAQAVPGAVQTAKENPYVMAELSRLNGIGEMPAELMQYAEEWEEVFTQNKNQQSERAKSLREKLETGQLSDFDKMGIALAVAIPVIMGLMYGGTAFALAAGGVLQSVGQMKSGEEKQRAKDKSDLQALTKEQLKYAEEGVKVKQGIIDKIPNKDAKRFVRDKEIQAFGDDLGISAGDEQRALWIDSKKIHDDEDVKKIRERTKEAEELIGGVNNFNEALNAVEEIISAIQDQDPGLFNILRSNYKALETTSPDQIANSSLGDILSLLSKIPGIAQNRVEIEIVGKDGKVTKINALDALQQSVKALQNDYNTAVLKGSRLTENVMKHWSGIMFDPTSMTQFLSSGVEGWAENAKNLRNIMNRKIQEELVGYGFIRKPLQEVYPVQERTILRPVSAVNRDINKNPDAYKSKVR